MANGQGTFAGLLGLIIALPLVGVIIKQTQQIGDFTFQDQKQKPKGGKRNA